MKWVGCKQKDRPASASLDSLPFASYPLTSYCTKILTHLRQKSNWTINRLQRGFHISAASCGVEP